MPPAQGTGGGESGATGAQDKLESLRPNLIWERCYFYEELESGHWAPYASFIAIKNVRLVAAEFVYLAWPSASQSL